MKDVFTRHDATLFHDVFVNSIKEFISNGKENYILLSGGIDSVCILYAIMEIGAPYTVVNFCFNGRCSIDTKSVRELQEKIGFNAEFLTLDCNSQNDLYDAIRMCVELYGHVRKVKVESIYAMLQVRRHIPLCANVLCGSWGDNALRWHRSDAMLIARVGEDHPDVLSRIRGDASNDEMAYVFRDYSYFDPYMHKAVTDVMVQFTKKACNAHFPKSALVLSFEDMFARYKNARRPISFCKASGEPQMFEDIATRMGYASELKMFNAIARDQLFLEE